MAGSPRKTRILHVVTSLEPGGLENGVVNLANNLDRSRFETAIVCLERFGEFCDRLAADVPVFCLKKPPGFQFGAVRSLARLLRERRPEVLHTHNLGPLVYGVLAKTLALSRSALLQGEHAELTPDEKSPRRLRMRRWFYRVCASGHVVSGGLKRDLSAAGLNGERFHVILNGVDCARFSPATSEERSRLREKVGIPAEAMVIGIVGRFGQFKGHERLLDAFDRLAASRPGLHLLMVGDHGPRREAALARREASECRPRIHWAGFQSDPLPFYRMMDLLVIPSENEGLSNAMLEAMACGVPCLANTACGAVEVIRDGKNGYLRPVGEVDSLTDALAALLMDTDALARAGSAARNTAATEFSLESMIAGYARLYESFWRDADRLPG